MCYDRSYNTAGNNTPPLRSSQPATKTSKPVLKTARGNTCNWKILTEFDQLDVAAQQEAVPKLLLSLCEGVLVCQQEWKMRWDFCLVWWVVGSDWHWSGLAWIQPPIDHIITAAMIPMPRLCYARVAGLKNLLVLFRRSISVLLSRTALAFPKNISLKDWDFNCDNYCYCSHPILPKPPLPWRSSDLYLHFWEATLQEKPSSRQKHTSAWSQLYFNIRVTQGPLSFMLF